MKIIKLLSNGRDIAVNILEIVYIAELEGNSPPHAIIKLRSSEVLSIDNSYSSIVEYLGDVGMCYEF